MARVFITGSSDGLGLMSGRLLAGQGHAVVLHARNSSRAEDARAALPEAAGVVTGDLSSLAGMRQVAEQADAVFGSGPFDAVIHNAGVGHRDQPRRVVTEGGLSRVFAVNVLAPVTQAWLAVSDDPGAAGTGGYFFHQQPQQVHPAARDVAFQDELLAYCAKLSGTELPT